MTIERVEELLGLLPPEAPYLARIPRPLSSEGIPTEVDICATGSGERFCIACAVPACRTR
jgi:hypothetical protein